MTDKLNTFWEQLNAKENFNSQEERFNSLSYNLMNYLCLVVGNNSYKITECEFYYTDSKHQDPYVHRGKQQMTAGQLYLNKAGGLDITFGNPDYHAYGGILIRGIRNLKTNKYINKITEIVAEIFSALDNIILERNCIYLAELTPAAIKIEQPIQTARVRLKQKDLDKENYIDKPYRYIIELVPLHKFHGREKVVKHLLAENKISSEQAKMILTYDLRQQ